MRRSKSGGGVQPWWGQYNPSIRLLKIEQDIDAARLGIGLQEAADLVVVKGKADECFLGAALDEFIVDSAIENGARRNLPRSADAALAFERKPGENELSHVVLRTFVNCDAIRNTGGFIVEVRRGGNFCVEEAMRGVGVLNPIPSALHSPPS